MANIGSVFLGDNVRHRMLSNTSPSSSTPSPSPPPSAISAVFPRGLSQSPPSFQAQSDRRTTPIDSRLALDLRLRWLEALLVGVGVGGGGSTSKTGRKSTEEAPSHTPSLCRAAGDLQQRLDAIVASHDGLRRFLAQCASFVRSFVTWWSHAHSALTDDQYAHFLSPAFALSDPASEGNTMSVAQLEALLTEMEPDIRAAERDMREIEMLESKGVTGAGKLASYEDLQPRLDRLLAQYQEDAELANSLEERIARLVERHATQVDTLSELFVAWDDAIADVEDRLGRFEKEKSERRRLGLEQ
ncbi:hypothetical protein C0993_009103 [Termitomyces sp. T159_Od127]|nr:hypothetical protein C0993_009103 [Termitomyces sp. T159_Od127]